MRPLNQLQSNSAIPMKYEAPPALYLNLFFTHASVRISAIDISDIHLATGITHVAQILSTVYRKKLLVDVPEEQENYYNFWEMWAQKDRPEFKGLYLPLRDNEYVRWARNNLDNYNMLFNYFNAMGREYLHRFSKNHKSLENSLLVRKLREGPGNFIGEVGGPVPCKAGSSFYQFRVRTVPNPGPQDWVVYRNSIPQEVPSLTTLGGNAIPGIEYRRQIPGVETFTELELQTTREPTIYERYQLYYARDKWQKCVWTKTQPPNWMIEYHELKGGRVLAKPSEKHTGAEEYRIVYD